MVSFWRWGHGIILVFAGIFWTITIIGIPLGKQCFKIGTLCLSSFGKYVLSPVGGTGNFLLNLFWICITGLPLAIIEITIGMILSWYNTYVTKKKKKKKGF